MCDREHFWLNSFLKNLFFSRSEPGYYKENDFGIRIEDVAVIVPYQTQVTSSADPMTSSPHAVTS